MEKIDSEKTIVFLRDNWKNPCPMCGVRKWNVLDTVFELHEYNKGSVVIGGTVMPLITVVCSNCGTTILINALTSGLIKIDKLQKNPIVDGSEKKEGNNA
jgi:hypothetical protein